MKVLQKEYDLSLPRSWLSRNRPYFVNTFFIHTSMKISENYPSYLRSNNRSDKYCGSGETQYFNYPYGRTKFPYTRLLQAIFIRRPGFPMGKRGCGRNTKYRCHGIQRDSFHALLCHYASQFPQSGIIPQRIFSSE